MTTIQRGLLLSASLFATFVGCAAPSANVSRAPSNLIGRQIVALPPDWLVSFTQGGARVLHKDTQAVERELTAPPTNYGRPITSSVDLGSLMAAVVHEHGLAVLNLTSSETEPVWLPFEWTKPPSSVFVSDAYAATLGGTEACVWDLTNATLVHRIDLAAWSKEHRLGPAVCVVPDRASASRVTVLFSSPESTDLEVLDVSRGSLEKVASASNIFENTRKTWWRVERCAYDGQRLFLSGTKESIGTNQSGQVVPQPSPFLMKLDLATREHEILFNENTHALDETVDELAAANGRVATVRRDGLLRVFQGHEKTYEAQVARGSALAWLSENSLAVFDATTLKVIQVH